MNTVCPTPSRSCPWFLLAALILFGLIGRAPAAIGTIQDVRHVVIFMQENRSFDHYFGTLAGVRGFGDRAPLTFTNGNSVFYQPLGRGTLLPFHVPSPCIEDLDHSWGGSHDAWHRGKWDAWIGAKTTTTMAYYTRADLAYYYALADAFTICDGYFCSVFGPTNPNRLYLWTGTVDPRGAAGGPVTDNSEPGFRWTTYPERLEKAGVSWKIYQQPDNYDDNALAWFNAFTSAKPGNPLHDRGMVYVNDIVTAFKADVVNNTLPRVSWVIAATTDSEHPPYSPASGEFVTRQLLNALTSNPEVYNSTVFILNYDENDGYYDHIPPPVPPAGTPDEFVAGVPIGLGVRVPALIISPWTRGGYVCSEIFDHTSVIRFLETWTGVMETNISAWRRKVCGDLTSAFDFTTANTNFPAFPSVSRVDCFDSFHPSIPTQQVFPLQEPGTKPARPVPYQPDARLIVDGLAGKVQIVMTNTGKATTHLSVYPNAYRNDGPWPYDVAPGGGWLDKFTVSTNQGRYDLSCYGPNGFLRRFTGAISNDLALVDARSVVDPNAGSIDLGLFNPSASPVTFTVAATAYQAGGPWIYPVPAGGTAVHTYYAVTNSAGWYEFTVAMMDSEVFQRRFAGHIEVSALRLSASWEGGAMVIRYPAWATAYTLEATDTLAPASWSAIGVVPQGEGSFLKVNVGAPSGRRFLRLRR